MFLSHEALILSFEETQVQSFKNEDQEDIYYDLSTHFLWIGERTSKFTEAHVEFFRGIANPVGMKVGPKKPISEVVQAIKALNPDNVMGKLVLIL